MKSANHFALPKPKSDIAIPANDAIPTDLLIGAGWREASNKKRIPVFNPANGEIITTIADATLEDAMAAIDFASSAIAEAESAVLDAIVAAKNAEALAATADITA